jgi:hypothetical protein
MCCIVTSLSAVRVHDHGVRVCYTSLPSCYHLETLGKTSPAESEIVAAEMGVAISGE